MSAVIGLDIGNDTSVIAAAKQRGVDVLLNDESKRETPSVVSFTPSQRLLGSAASASSLINPRSTVSHLKRLLARSFRDPSLQHELRFLPFALSEGPDGCILVRVKYRNTDYHFTPVQLLAMLMSHLRKLAERALDPAPISDCVIGIPAYFTDAQRRAYVHAATIAGLHPLRLMQEGAAIALGYGIYRTDIPVGPVVFVDVGHCDTQVSVARFEAGKVLMLAYASDRDLGGRDFDEVLFEHFVGQFKKQYNIDVLENVKACIRLRAACEKVKKVLSANAEAPLNVECLMEEKDVSGFIKREEFEKLSEGLLNRIMVTCSKALEDAGLAVDELHSVELVGSGSRIPAISKCLMEFFGRELSRTLNASECIARGCALQCAMLSPIFRVRPYEVQDSLPFSIGFLTDKDNASAVPGCMLKKGQPIPSTKILIFRRCKTFDIEAVYATRTELPPGASQRISCSTIGPFELSDGEKAKVKVKVRFDLHGIVHIESASLIEDDVYKQSSRSPPDSNSESELCSGVSDAVHAVENGRLPDGGSTGPVEEHPLLDDKMKQQRFLRRQDLEVAQRIFGGMTEGELAEAQSLEEDLAAKDRIVEETKDKKNALEAYVYEIRNKLLDRYRSFANELEKQEITENLQQIEEWLYEEDDDDESVEVCTDKMNVLGKLVDPIERRYKEEEARAQATKELFTCIVSLRQIEKSSFPSYVVNEVISECQKAENWVREKGKQQESVPKNADPILWSEEIIKKMEELKETYQQLVRTRTVPRPDNRNIIDRIRQTEDMEED